MTNAVDKAAKDPDLGEVGDQQLVGAVVVKHRSTRSAARLPGRSEMVVRTFLVRTTPRHPSRRISRSTVQRATGMPNRCR
jgi:hypothetical protein